MERVRNLFDRLRHGFRVRRLAANSDPSYREYLSVQFERTYSKRNQVPARRSTVLMDRLCELGTPNLDGAVLCIGPRDTFEIESFKRVGFRKVLGIDLLSQGPGVLIMDMHRMTFPDDSFDVVYASHSLEHSYDPARVVGEILRVAKEGAILAVEVPIKFTPQGADRFDFGGVDGVHKLFGAHLDRIVWTDEQPPGSPMNGSGTAVARTIFVIRKGVAGGQG
ncbi:MAG: class I SAM-dependent methyltransferase [Desulfomonile sp.]|nr:class I SAM-dependent methyltransferase [Desulfomonile sp.]